MDEQLTSSVSKEDLVERSKFLYDLLSLEFQVDDDVNFFPDFNQVLERMSERNLISLNNEEQQIFISQKENYIFISSLLFPFIDSFWVASVALNSLLGRSMKESTFLSTSVWLMEKFFVENVVSFYDCCSLEIMKNAVKHFEKNGIIYFSLQDEIKLSQSMDLNSNLTNFNSRIFQYRKIPFHKYSKKRGEVSQYPLFVSKI